MACRAPSQRWSSSSWLTVTKEESCSGTRQRSLDLVQFRYSRLALDHSLALLVQREGLQIERVARVRRRSGTSISMSSGPSPHKTARRGPETPSKQELGAQLETNHRHRL